MYLHPEIIDHSLLLVPWRIVVVALQPLVHRLAAGPVAQVAGGSQVPTLILAAKGFRQYVSHCSSAKLLFSEELSFEMYHFTSARGARLAVPLHRNKPFMRVGGAIPLLWPAIDIEPPGRR
mgnify:CR=1 FL=1